MIGVYSCQKNCGFYVFGHIFTLVYCVLFCRPQKPPSRDDVVCHVPRSLLSDSDECVYVWWRCADD